ncbi:fucolectin-like [Branchiostoma floridae]|uniref:Fucolectin-like n=1 Tax=Branchiostoma floridae TaxID=7739 RepID=A0A9J7MIV4_BRAFL|nr:fucolectin-like [Branchiostoma floridae]
MAARLLLTLWLVFLVGRTVWTEEDTGPSVALGKPAFQSSTYADGGAASRAVDGNGSPYWASRSCTHTKQEDNPTWWVDLGQSYVVNSVLIVNRRDCCSERLNPFNIHIGDSDQVSTNPKCGGDHQIDVAKHYAIRVSCPGMRGRFVAVRLPGPSRILELKGPRLMCATPNPSKLPPREARSGNVVDAREARLELSTQLPY